jgi:hypothetical protein
MGGNIMKRYRSDGGFVRTPEVYTQGDRYYAQGARCGHLEGKDRADSYVLDEEIDLSWQAAENQEISSYFEARFSSGYRLGYTMAVEGYELPQEYVDYPLPTEK